MTHNNATIIIDIMEKRESGIVHFVPQGRELVNLPTF
jgi:hypothetical protein